MRAKTCSTRARTCLWDLYTQLQRRQAWDGTDGKLPHMLGISAGEARGSVRRPLPAIA
ncbi:hypothetical protein GCM10010377_73700 [Streptomyces viridiviolaceus]|nr:hypothetical protein GCM10010377_73700 [Streptomyces viridiviolaceus]